MAAQIERGLALAAWQGTTLADQAGVICLDRVVMTGAGLCVGMGSQGIRRFPHARSNIAII